MFCQRLDTIKLFQRGIPINCIYKVMLRKRGIKLKVIIQVKGIHRYLPLKEVEVSSCVFLS